MEHLLAGFTFISRISPFRIEHCDLKFQVMKFFFTCFLFSQLLHAQIYRINNGSSQEITAHTVCQSVTNSTGRDLMVPTGTAAEWLAFRTNFPTGVVLASCNNAAWYDANWNFRFKVTIDQLFVDSNLTNFVVVVRETGVPAGFWTNVRSDGADIVVTASDGTTKLDRELVSINTGTSRIELHAKIPSVSGSLNTEFYVYYGRASGGESNVTTTWSQYSHVYHMDVASPLDRASTNNIASSTGATVVTGQLGSGLDFSGTGRLNFTTTITGASIRTLSFWYYPRGQGGGNFGSVFGSADYNNGIRHTGTDSLNLRRASANVVSTSAGFSAWKHIAFSYNSTSGQVSLYENGAFVSAATLSGGWYAIPHLISISAATDRAPNGILDEMRVSGNTLTAPWIKAEYENQKASSTFLQLGPETPKP